MEVAEFLKTIGEYKEGQLFFLYGTEDYLRETALERLMEQFPYANREMNVDSREGKATAAEIRAVCEQLPCFAGCRVVLLHNLELFEKGEAKPLTEYLGQAPATTKIVFLLDHMPDARRALYKYLEKNAVCVQAKPLKEGELVRWVVTSARRRKLKLSREDAGFLVERSGTDMRTLLHELDKFAALGRTEVSREDIEALASRTTEYDTFSFHRLMLERKYEAAFGILREIARSRPEYMKFLGLIASKFTPMVLAKTCLNAGYSESAAAAELVKRAKLKRYPAELAVRECKHFTVQQLRRSIALLDEYDLALKSGGVDEGWQPMMLKIYGVI